MCIKILNMLRSLKSKRSICVVGNNKHEYVPAEIYVDKGRKSLIIYDKIVKDKKVKVIIGPIGTMGRIPQQSRITVQIPAYRKNKYVVNINYDGSVTCSVFKPVKNKFNCKKLFSKDVTQTFYHPDDDHKIIITMGASGVIGYTINKVE